MLGPEEKGRGLLTPADDTPLLDLEPIPVFKTVATQLNPCKPQLLSISDYQTGVANAL